MLFSTSERQISSKNTKQLNHNDGCVEKRLKLIDLIYILLQKIYFTRRIYHTFKSRLGTSKNTVYQDFNKGERINIYNLFGDKKVVKDDLIKELGKSQKEKDLLQVMSVEEPYGIKMIPQEYMHGTQMKYYQVQVQKHLMDCLAQF